MVMPPSASDIDARAHKVRALLVDVDGVLTDGRVWTMPDGGEARAFHVRDFLGIQLVQASGLKVGFISGKSSPTVQKRGEDLGVALLMLGVDDKVEGFDKALKKLGVKADEVCYVGDDLPDLPLIRKAGLGCAVADAAPEVRASANIILRANGGQGAVREVCERILKAKGNWRV